MQSPARDTSNPPNAPALAGYGDRFLATLVDAIFFMAVFWVVGAWAAGKLGGVTANGFNLHGQAAGVTIGLVLLISLAYYWLAEGLFGATLGKALIGIRVRGLDGGPISLGASLVRTLARLIDGIGVYLVGLAVAALSKRRQRIGDHLAHTIVVQNAAASRTPRVIAAAGLVTVIAAAVVLTMTFRRSAAQSSIASDARMIAGDDAPNAPAPAQQKSASSSGANAGSMTLTRFDWLGGKGGSPRASAPYHPGDTVFANFNIANYSVDPNGAVHVVLRLIALDPSAVAMHEPWPIDVHADHTDGSPIIGSYDVHLPPFASPGTYTVRIEAHDASSNTDTVFAPSFTVDAPVPVPASALELRNFHFASAPKGSAVDSAVFRAGETLYFGFQLAGIQFKDNRPDLHVDLALIGPSGSPLIDRADWISTSEEMVYHPATFFFPVDSYLRLPSPLTPGRYTQRVTVHDKAANADVTHEEHFEVR